jgi:VanZ family protein
MPNPGTRSTLSRWLPVVIWMAVIFNNSTDSFSSSHTSRFIEPLLRFLFPHLTPDGIETLHTLIRKSAHVFEYAALGALLWRALPAWKRTGIDWRRAGIALAIATAYGASDEFHQIFVPSRGASVHDVVIDASGAAVALMAVATARRRAAEQPGRSA